MIRPAIFIAGAIALSACAGDAPETDSALLDAELIGGNIIDPAVMSALHDPIMVDPNLSQQGNANAVRPAAQPYSAPIPASDVARRGDTAAIVGREELLVAPDPVQPSPGCEQCEAGRGALTLGALAAQQKAGESCAADIHYSNGWARRLPADLPLIPNARITEAAGVQGDSCNLRVVSFWSDLPVETTVNWYYTRATRAGYTSERRLDDDGQMLGGTRRQDEGAYVIFLNPRAGGGTEIDLVVNNGI